MTSPASATLPTAPGVPARASGQPPATPVRPPPDLTWMRRLLWFYLGLWVCEGALRKWIFPSLATPLLIVRDPFLLLMYVMALQKGIFPRGLFIAWIAGISFLAMTFSFVGGRAPLVVQLYGYRADFMHLPLVFLIPKLFNRDDVLRAGKWALLIALPMSFLVLLQFKSSPGSRLNVGVGGEGTMLDAGFGHIRPSGTFSFTNGMTEFTTAVTAFCLYGLLVPRAFPRLLRWASLPALAAMILLSASRGVVGAVIIVLATTILISLLQPRFLAPTAKILGVCLLGALVVGSVAVFQDGLEVFAWRFGNAANVREGFVGRFFGSLLVPFQLYDRVDFYGVGLGMGTKVGAGLLYEGERKILFDESELGRVMFESGPVVGPAFLLLRVCIVGFLFFQALRSLRRGEGPLALLLLGAGGLELMMGPLGNATTLGYVTTIGGLCLAANRPGLSEEKAAALSPVAASGVRPARPLPSLPPAPRAEALPGGGPAPVGKPAAPPAAPAAARGRSLYAEQMHREAEEGRRQKAEGRRREEENEPPG